MLVPSPAIYRLIPLFAGFEFPLENNTTSGAIFEQDLKGGSNHLANVADMTC
jgi:hypothetical protein